MACGTFLWHLWIALAGSGRHRACLRLHRTRLATSSNTTARPPTPSQQALHVLPRLLRHTGRTPAPPPAVPPPSCNWQLRPPAALVERAPQLTSLHVERNFLHSTWPYTCHLQGRPYSLWSDGRPYYAATPARQCSHPPWVLLHHHPMACDTSRWLLWTACPPANASAYFVDSKTKARPSGSAYANPGCSSPALLW
jgi:hypothetical protein